MSTVISSENLSKAYRLGQIGTGTFTNDLKLWWAKVRGKPNPLLKIGEADHGNRDSEMIWALKDVSFTVEQGEVLGIIGRNGAGKSTLLKILSRVTAPTSGRIRVRGRVASLLEVGTGFHPELTGRENIYLNGTILGMNRKEIDRKFDEIVDFAEIKKFIDTPVKRYSSGMYVRLAFAIAAHLEPEVLVVDEVLAVGDTEFQKKCLGKMGDVAKEGRTVLFVSHNMPAIQSLCQKVMLMKSGRLDAIGMPDEIIAGYVAGTESEREGNLTGITTGRDGNGALRFTRWSVVDEMYGEGYIVGCNHSCEFRISYESEGGMELRNVSTSLTIKDTFERPILTGATLFQGKDFARLPASGTLLCRFEKLPLLPNSYKVHLWCKVGSEIADRITDAGSFAVVDNDVFGSGKMPQSGKHGLIASDFTWRQEGEILGK